MPPFRAFALVLCAATLGTTPVSAATRSDADLGAVRTMVGCRDVQPAEARLACYDQNATALQALLQREGVMILDKQDIQAAQKNSFGFNGSEAPLARAAAEKTGVPARVEAIDGRIKSARQGPDGKWVFVLDDNSRWAQTDGNTARTPKTGDAIHIKRAALGSFMANINDGRAIRVRRVN